MKLLKSLLIVLFASTLAAGALAAEVMVKKRATLRSDPSTERPPIAVLLPDEHVELLEPSPTAGYYHVRSEEGEEGWIYSRNVEVITETPPPPPPSSQPSSSPLSAPATDALVGSVTSNIPTDWDKPPPNSTTFDGPDGHCGPTGDGGDTVTNARKNRTDVSSAYHPTTWKALRRMPYPVAEKSLADWTPEQLSQIEPYQGIAVTVVGYLAALKPQNHGSGESTNCHFTNSEEVDWHMALVEKSGDAESTSVVVETTPRVRKLHPSWTPHALAAWLNSDAPVRISGWTLLDPEHRAHLGKYRSTLWEIHPITKIEVFQDGTWVDLDHLH
jgi:hypothetical protein